MLFLSCNRQKKVIKKIWLNSSVYKFRTVNKNCHFLDFLTLFFYTQ